MELPGKKAAGYLFISSSKWLGAFHAANYDKAENLMERDKIQA